MPDPPMDDRDKACVDEGKTVGYSYDDTDGGEKASFSLTGQILGDYAVLEVIGAGGGGQVYKAQHRHMGRIVAIKVLPQEAMANPVVVKRFRREMKAAAKLMHPNIVTAFDAGNVGTVHYLVMEYVEGRSLAEVVRRDGPMSLGEAARCLIQVARGVAYAHRQGIVHRDLKPGNIMLAEPERQPKILDMGLARLNDLTSFGDERSTSNLTGHGIVVGSIGYISPEQISNSAEVDHRTDIYSLGCTMHYLLTGNTPYSGSMVETLVAHTNDPIPTLSAYRTDIPQDVDDIFRRMVAKKCEDRIQSMDQVADLLQRFESLSAAPPQLTTPVSSTSQRTPDSTSYTQRVAKSVGFDLGNRHSYVSFIGDDGVPVPCPSSDGELAMSSIVRFHNGLFQVGQKAIENLATLGTEDMATRVVGKMGTFDGTLRLANRDFPAEVIAAVIIRELAAQARRRIGYFSHASYTYPSCFGDSRRQAYKSALQIAGISLLEPINSASASTAYFAFMHGWLNPHRVSEIKHVLTLRYGAGSCDASIIRIAEQTITTLAVVGDPDFGGQLWTQRIVDYAAEQLRAQHAVDVYEDPVELFHLFDSCEQAKLAVSGEERVPITFRAKGKSLSGVLTRDFLRKMGIDLLEQLGGMLDRVLAAADISWADLDHVLLTGGGTRMPLVKDHIVQCSGIGPKCAYLDAVASSNGAALFAQSQIEPNCPTMRLTVEEVSSHYYAVKAVGGSNISVVVPQNTQLPTAVRVPFRTSKVGQSSVALEIAEGHDAEQQIYRPVGVVRILNLPPGLPAGTLIELEIHVARDGTLSVFFESSATGRHSSLPIERSVGPGPVDFARWRDWLDTGSLVGEFD